MTNPWLGAAACTLALVACSSCASPDSTKTAEVVLVLDKTPT